MPGLAQRILGEAGEIFFLELVLEGDPVGPDLVERLAEHMLEMARVKGLRILRAAEPVHGLVDAVGQREVGKEARAVEVGVGADLEVDLRAFALQPERREQPQMVMHLGAEHHLVIAALGAAKPAGHPGFVEDRASFHVPARRQVPGAGEEIVEDRFRVLLQRHRLAAEEMPPEGVAAVPHVDRADVRQLMVHQRVEAFARARRSPSTATKARRRAGPCRLGIRAPRHCRSRRSP